MKVYLVGGAVRDQLLEYPYHEQDWVVVGETPASMLALGYQQVGKDFPVFLHPKTKEEYALARTERKIGPGYGGFSFETSKQVSLEQDLGRRDLTINAIAQTPEGELVDPYHGQVDIDKKLLRHVSSAFAEDPVRILRTARFASRYFHLGFTVAPETMELMSQMTEQGEVDHLVPERSWKEFHRALAERNPEVFVQVLRQCGALKSILPELDALFGVPQRKDFHPEIDCGIHSLMVLEQACLLSSEPCVRFAALIHDLGKASTPKDVLPRHIGHEKRSLKLVKRLCSRLKVPTEFQQLALQVAEYHSHSHRAFELKPATLLKMFQSLDVFRKPERFEQFLLCCIADSRGRTGYENIDYPQAQYLSQAANKVRAIDTKELMAQGYSGLELGEALQRSRTEALSSFKQEQARAQND